jgi:serine/threonine protein kinase
VITAPRIIGRYALYGKIASGGMATVHFGRLLGPVGFSRTVAIKKLHPHFTEDPEFVSMFLDEARLAARIRHPNVVPTLDVVATEGELFLVMDYVQGETLARLLRLVGAKREQVPLPVIAAIFSGVLHGLHAAHEAKNERGEPLGIVHRDVSPQNIIVGLDGVPRVLDFGVAKATGRLQTTREGQIKGKISYMAPEQIHGTPATRQTDLYGISVVLWEALTCKRLFQGENEAAVLQRVLAGDVLPASSHVPGLPPALDAIVARGMSRDPTKRFATAREMASALEALLPLAIPVQVGEWVEQTAGINLASQAARVAEIESGSDPLTLATLAADAAEVSSAVESSAPDSVRIKTTLRIPTQPPPPLVLPPVVAEVAAVAAVERTLVDQQSPLLGAEPRFQEPGEAEGERSAKSQLSSISVSTPQVIESSTERQRLLRRVVAGVFAASAVLALAGLALRASHGIVAEPARAAEPAPAPSAQPEPPPSPITSRPAPEPPAPSASPASVAVEASASPAAARVPPPSSAASVSAKPPAPARAPTVAPPTSPPRPTASPRPAPSGRPEGNILFTNPG